MKIYDGRDSFYQWDINQKLTATSLKVGDEIHFTNARQPFALVLIAYEFNGKVVVNVPNMLLQMAIPIIVYRYANDGKSGYTIEEYAFTVNQRPRPDDYVYSETEVLNYTSLEKRVSRLETGGTGGGGAVDPELVEQIVEDYLAENPPHPGEKGEKGDPGRDGVDGYTPVKGKDYYTEADKTELVQLVLSELPNGDEVAY